MATRRPDRPAATKEPQSLQGGLSDTALAALEADKRELKKVYLKKGEPLPEWVFPNRDAKPHNMTNVRNRIFYRVRKGPACIGGRCRARGTHSPRCYGNKASRRFTSRSKLATAELR